MNSPDGFESPSGEIKQTAGLEVDIIRRDFLKGTLLGSGALLLNMPAPGFAQPIVAPVTGFAAWDGYAGIGDYSRAHGNMGVVRETAHLIRDNKVDALLKEVIDTGEAYDLIVVGGGFSGLGAARTFLREGKSGQTCLVLENHALAGGEAKRNEFVVNGHKIIGPQGSNLVVLPSEKGWYDDLWTDLGIPRDPKYQALRGFKGSLRISRDNYIPMLGVADNVPSAGYYFDAKTFGGNSRWDFDSRRSAYKTTGFPDVVKADLKRLIIDGAGKNLAGDNYEKWLDSITYTYYLEEVLGINAQTSRLLDAPLTVEGGLGADCVSALFALKVGMPGFDKEFPLSSLYKVIADKPEDLTLYSFPGGNDAVFRLLLKKVVPEAIAGNTSFQAVHSGRFQFDKFDLPDRPVRIRLNSTAVRIEHTGDPNTAREVTVIYSNGGKLYRARAKGVVSAIGGWVNKHIVQGLPKSYQSAFGQHVYGSCMIVNVALTNWRFMAKLGISAAHYFMDGRLGQVCNFRQPMIIGDDTPPLNPNKPIVLTFYIGFANRGMPAREQAANARWQLVSKTFKEIEVQIRNQMVEMFGPSGFDPVRDIAGIVLNRWGHSYVTPTPGFYHGIEGKPAPTDIIKERFGRIAFGHSELNGIQEWFGGVAHGERAARQILEVI